MKLSIPSQPSFNCNLCPRLKEFRENNRLKYPDWYNAPVLSFSGIDVKVLIVGLAPGLRGANKTGRPFTGDYAGELLYQQLDKHGFSKGQYAAKKGDGLALVNCRITNAVRCVPPKNKPINSELLACQSFLIDEIFSLPQLQIILALGTVSHGAVLTALGQKKSAYKFGHNKFHNIKDKIGKNIILADSYHCSRYNTNTGRLTESMFESVFEGILNRIS